MAEIKNLSDGNFTEVLNKTTSFLVTTTLRPGLAEVEHKTSMVRAAKEYFCVLTTFFFLGDFFHSVSHYLLHHVGSYPNQIWSSSNT